MIKFIMLYFVRHGESLANAQHVFAGQKNNSPLSKKGKDQAYFLAEKIQKENIIIHQIICSPLTRAVTTASIIMNKLQLTNIQIDNRLTEYDMGELTNKPIYNITSLELISAAGSENVHDFYKRVSSCIHEYKLKDGNTLIVSHAGVARIIEAKFKGILFEQFYDLPAYKNGEIIPLNFL